MYLKIKYLLVVLMNNGDLDRTRTCYLKIRNLALYPDELRGHSSYLISYKSLLSTVRLFKNNCDDLITKIYIINIKLLRNEINEH